MHGCGAAWPQSHPVIGELHSGPRTQKFTLKVVESHGSTGSVGPSRMVIEL